MTTTTIVAQPTCEFLRCFFLLVLSSAHNMSKTTKGYKWRQEEADKLFVSTCF